MAMPPAEWCGSGSEGRGEGVLLPLVSVSVELLSLAILAVQGPTAAHPQTIIWF